MRDPHKSCPECGIYIDEMPPPPTMPAMTVEDYQRALEELDKREGLTDEQKQHIRNQMESVLLPAISPV